MTTYQLLENYGSNFAAMVQIEYLSIVYRVLLIFLDCSLCALLTIFVQSYCLLKTDMIVMFRFILIYSITLLYL